MLTTLYQLAQEVEMAVFNVAEMRRPRDAVADFFSWNGSFDAKYAGKLRERWPTFKIALNIFLQRGGSTIVETGCERSIGHGWTGDGNSTYLFGDFLSRYGGRLWTCDINPEAVDTAKLATREFASRITYVCDDSATFLSSFDRPIDLLYLDSLDCPREGDARAAQEHNLRELTTALPSVSADGIVLLDDNWYENGGKTRLSKQYLADQSWICLFDSRQTVWVR